MRVYIYNPDKKVDASWPERTGGRPQPHCVECGTGLGLSAHLQRKRCNACRRERWAERKRLNRAARAGK